MSYLIVYSIVNKSWFILFGVIARLIGFGIIFYFLLFLSLLCRRFKLALRPGTLCTTLFLSLFACSSSWGLLFRSDRLDFGTSLLSFFIECLLYLGLLLSLRWLLFFLVFFHLFRLLLVFDSLLQNFFLFVFAIFKVITWFNNLHFLFIAEDLEGWELIEVASGEAIFAQRSQKVCKLIR